MKVRELIKALGQNADLNLESEVVVAVGKDRRKITAIGIANTTEGGYKLADPILQLWVERL